MFFFPTSVGGAEHSLLDRAKSLMKFGHDVYVLTISADGKTREFDVDGVHVLQIRVPWFFSHPYHKERKIIDKVVWHLAPLFFFGFGFFNVRRWIDSHKFNSCFVINTPGIPYALLMNHGVVNVYSVVADYNYICMNGAMYSSGVNCEGQCVKCKCFSKIKRPILTRSRNVVYISDFMRDVYEENLGLNNGVVIYNGESVRGSYKQKTEVVVGEVYVVGFIGQVKDSKGLHVLAEAMKSLMDRGFRVSLSVAGEVEENYKTSVEKIVSNISWLGRVDKDDFYQQIDLVVVPSIWNEPLGRVPFEAALRYVPVIVSNRGGLPETVYTNLNCFDPSKMRDRFFPQSFIKIFPKII